MRQCRIIRDFLLSTPPDPTSVRPKDLLGLMQIGRKFLEVGEDRIYETIRFWTMSVAEYLDEYFETDVIKAAMSGSGIIGTALGIHSPGTAYVLLHHYMGDVDGNVGSWGFARGGMGAVSNAIAGAFQSYGGELRTEAGVDKIIVRNGKARGVGLENGDELSANIVVSAMDVKRTFLTCMDRSDLDEDFHTRVENFKIRGSSGKLNIALDGLPTFPALPEGSSLLVERPLYRHGDAHDRRSDHGAAGQALHELLHPVLPVRVGRSRLDRSRARSVREDGHQPDRELQPRLQRPDRPLRSSHTRRYRGTNRYHRGQYLPRRIDDGPAAFQSAGARLCTVPFTG
jgi:hypothetical protein